MNPLRVLRLRCLVVFLFVSFSCDQPVTTQKTYGPKKPEEMVRDFSVGDYIIASDNAGRRYAFQVMGHVAVKQALRSQGQFKILEWTYKNPEIAPARPTPISDRFDHGEFVLELVLLGPPLASLEQADTLVKGLDKQKRPTIHILDSEQALKLSWVSVVRIDFLEFFSKR